MIDDRRGSMPFSIIAVAILLMAAVAGSVMAEHARSANETEMISEATENLDRSLDNIESYLDRELGILILEISKDGSLGSLDDRARAFEKRAYTWLDGQFPMVDGGITAHLVDRDLSLTAESMEILSDEIGRAHV